MLVAAGLAILTGIAVVWLSAFWGFLGAVALAVVWCIALEREAAPSRPSTGQRSVEMSRARRAELLRGAEEARAAIAGPVGEISHVGRLGLATRLRCLRLERRSLAEPAATRRSSGTL
jgi:hypothetical protein